MMKVNTFAFWRFLLRVKVAGIIYQSPNLSWSLELMYAKDRAEEDMKQHYDYILPYT